MDATSLQTYDRFGELLIWKEKDLKNGDWVYTPDEVFGSGGKGNQIFQFDEKINYSLHFGHDMIFFKLQPKIKPKGFSLIHWGGWHGFRRGSVWYNGKCLLSW